MKPFFKMIFEYEFVLNCYYYLNSFLFIIIKIKMCREFKNYSGKKVYLSICFKV